ncbi:hypothetical protein E4V51_19405 [Paenibacillus sp. 28ISP30-2]|nr:hypothetical protein [Paenibacillus sp. 28ISP30-2]
MYNYFFSREKGNRDAERGMEVKRGGCRNDLSWVKETDEDTQHWKNLFKGWAQANTYVNRLLSGEVGILAEYVSYIEPRKNEIFSALVNIIEAANRFNIDVDNILQRFEKEITEYIQQQQQAVGHYTQQHISEQFTRFLHELAFYYLSKGIYPDGFEYLLICLGKSSIINNKSSIIKCIGLFELFREQAFSETKAAYQKLIKEVYANEKKNRDNVVGD